MCSSDLSSPNDVIVEPRSAVNDENKHPDIYVRLLHTDLWIDFSVTTPSSNSFCTAAATTKLSAAAIREAHKSRYYTDFMASNPGVFIPFVMESYGAFGRRCREIITMLARHAVRVNGYTNMHEFKVMAYRKMAFALQRGNAIVSDVGMELGRRRTAEGANRNSR